MVEFGRDDSRPFYEDSNVDTCVVVKVSSSFFHSKGLLVVCLNNHCLALLIPCSRILFPLSEIK